jgi:predicted double-glycine peptidase
MNRQLALVLSALLLCSCASTQKVPLFEAGKLEKIIKASAQVPVVTPLKAVKDRSGGALALAALLQARKGITRSEEEAYKDLIEKSDWRKQFETEKTISLTDIGNVLATYGLTARTAPTRYSTDGSYRKGTLASLAFVGNEQMQSVLPFVALISFQAQKDAYFVVIDAIDKKYLYALDPAHGRIAFKEEDFIRYSPMVLFVADTSGK